MSIQMRFVHRRGLSPAAFLSRAGPTHPFVRPISAMGSKQQPAHSPTTSSEVDTTIVSLAKPHCNDATIGSRKSTLQASMASRKIDQAADSCSTISQVHKANVISHAEGIVTVWPYLW